MKQEIVDQMKANLAALRNNSYPGRGIIQGLTPDGHNFVQIYWIMGRSENSRNRIFVNENGFIKTKAYDEAKVTDPSLIIYYPAKFSGGSHIVTNGDQTDTIFNALKAGATFESALNTREFEPDSPNHTPRISGIINLSNTGNQYAYQLSIIKGVKDFPDACIRNYFNYEIALPGVGHCLHTYMGDGNPLPSFAGEPYVVELQNDINQLADYYWDVLNQENRISLLVKFIHIANGESHIKLINKLAKE
jgi:IMP cyclohydrolase